MKLTEKTVGLGVIAAAVLLLGTAAIAEKMGDMPMGMGMGMRGHGMMAPALDIAAVDTDKDGKISKDELTAFHAARVAAMDTNGDGKMSVEELAAMHMAGMNAAAQNMAERMIENLDTDGDKMLSAAEMVERPAPTKMFDRVDANSDGFLDQTEIDAAKQAMNDRGQGGKHGHRGHGKNGSDGN